MSSRPIRVLIVDDHPVVVKGLIATLCVEPGMIVAGSASSGPEAVRLHRELLPDVTIMDLGMTREMTGIDATQAIRSEFPQARIIVFSMYQGDEDIHRALQAGAATFLLKESLSERLVETIREVCAGGRPLPPEVAVKLGTRTLMPALTAREVDVVALIAQGLRNKEIAEQLQISEYTAQDHVKNILAKLKVTDRAGAVTAALKRGILHIDHI